MTVQLLDCTLRDGGHTNNSKFGAKVIGSLERALSMANVDIIELGFLRSTSFNKDVALYPDVSNAEVWTRHTNCAYSLMVRSDAYDYRRLPQADGKIKFIRIAFYIDGMYEALLFAQHAMACGYQVLLNMVNGAGKSESALKEYIRHINYLHPFGVTVVDTFGLLRLKQACELTRFYDENLDSDIVLGLHFHNNLQLGFAMAIQCCELAKQLDRNVIIDGSILGLGRNPGNVPLELLVAYLNESGQGNYALEPILDVADNIIGPLKKNLEWGYSIPYFLSAYHKVHRTYAEYLSAEQCGFEKMDGRLQSIPESDAEHFSREAIKDL